MVIKLSFFFLGKYQSLCYDTFSNCSTLIVCFIANFALVLGIKLLSYCLDTAVI